ncbi:hypothetical protein H9654_08845 [Stenotrophomonas sp. Sa5BUN4]|uniref:Fimbrial-type adhesion domain-containing protein n=1 Tax=Stenotrophomonas lacuserhaii TaxID=2760084 RepID=A0A8X8FLV3_9GAMM|nr:hypothetical protein [Stenotrophomonas pennii]MBD7954313.1 hypothetical protein [Stenotrophomonas pennii]
MKNIVIWALLAWIMLHPKAHAVACASLNTIDPAKMAVGGQSVQDAGPEYHVVNSIETVYTFDCSPAAGIPDGTPLEVRIGSYRFASSWTTINFEGQSYTSVSVVNPGASLDFKDHVFTMILEVDISGNGHFQPVVSSNVSMGSISPTDRTTVTFTIRRRLLRRAAIRGNYRPLLAESDMVKIGAGTSEGGFQPSLMTKHGFADLGVAIFATCTLNNDVPLSLGSLSARDVTLQGRTFTFDVPLQSCQSHAMLVQPRVHAHDARNPTNTTKLITLEKGDGYVSGVGLEWARNLGGEFTGFSLQNGVINGTGGLSFPISVTLRRLDAGTPVVPGMISGQVILSLVYP